MYKDLIALTTAFELKCVENEKALVLARDLIARESAHVADRLEAKLESICTDLRRLEKISSTHATQDRLDREIVIARNHTDDNYKTNSDRIGLLAKLIYIGLGILIAIEILLRFIKP
jgi:hypothetical protein